MKVIKISDQAYAQVCQVASELETYLSDALDQIIFGKVGETSNPIGEQHTPVQSADAPSRLQDLEQEVTLVQKTLKELISKVGKVPEHGHPEYLPVTDWKQEGKETDDRLALLDLEFDGLEKHFQDNEWMMPNWKRMKNRKK